MGMNYYAYIPIVEIAINKIELSGFDKYDFLDYKKYPVHICKSSIGWKIHFAYNEGKYYKTWKEFKEWLKDKIIKDENHVEHSSEDFINWIEERDKDETLLPPADFEYILLDGRYFLLRWFA